MKNVLRKYKWSYIRRELGWRKNICAPGDSRLAGFTTDELTAESKRRQAKKDLRPVSQEG